MKILRDDLELRRKQELHETEERKNAHIRDLMRKHRQAFNEIKNYYNDITSNNLDLIKTLKEDVAEMKKKEALNEKLMYEISMENKRLAEPLNRALKVRWVISLRHLCLRPARNFTSDLLVSKSTQVLGMTDRQKKGGDH
jgi:hypothetical protein